MPRGSWDEGGGQAVTVVSPAGQEGGGGSTSGQGDSGRIIPPVWVSPPGLLSVRGLFVFLNRSGVRACISIHSP